MVKIMKKYDFILFDLDGTLTASAKGVRISLEHAMEALSLPCPDLSDYTLYVGPPLEDIFRDICSVPEELIPQAMQLYRVSQDDRDAEPLLIHSNVHNGWGILGALSYDRHFVEYGD